jgi:glycosyltransferase involved in cell wall biosynthesis
MQNMNHQIDMDISVVVPLYNKEEYICRAVRSIALQTFQPREIVIVNDGSTDDSVRVVESLNVPNLRVVHQKNQGVSSARNNGIHEARYTWVAFLDADDEWMPDFLSTMRRLHEVYPEQDVYASAYYLGDYNGSKRKIVLNGIMFNGNEGLLSNYFNVAAQSSPPVCSSSVCIRKQALMDINGFPLNIKSGEDLLTWARLAAIQAPAYSTMPLAVFWQVKSHTYDDRPNRVPEALDPVGHSLAELKKVRGQEIPFLDKYISHWHKMRASVFLRLEMRSSAFKECILGIYYQPNNIRLYIYILMMLLPDRVVMSLFKRFAGKVSDD